MEVFSKQPPMIQQFLEQTSILDVIEEELCDEVIGIVGASSMLEQLKERNLFIQKIGRNHYRYHALFKEFLENAFQKNNPNNYTALHEKCARFYEKRLMWEEALYHYKKIKHFKAMASILQEHGSNMLEGGKLKSLSDQLMFIPVSELDSYYHLWFLKAEVHRYRSQYQEAEECYERTFLAAENRNDFLEMSKALEGKAKIYLDTIQPHHAEKLLYEAIEAREKSISSEEEKVKLYYLLAENLLNSGKASNAEKWLKKAKEASPALLDVNIRSKIVFEDGAI